MSTSSTIMMIFVLGMYSFLFGHFIRKAVLNKKD
jgi:hypothetical protein